MSLALKHIPCPAGNKCTAFHCIFGHENKEDEAPKAAGGVSPRGDDKSQPANLGSNLNDDRPRKRLKTDDAAEVKPPENDVTNSSPGAPPNNVEQEASHGTDTPLRPHADAPRTATRPVSPPPLKRAQVTDKLPSHSPAPSNASRSVGRQANTSRSTETSKTQKKESLNPRLLKSSPASHEIRLKLLKLLHHEFRRLNSELKKDANNEEQKLVCSDQELIWRALDEEEATATEKAAVYPNVMKNKVMQYKRMSVVQWKAERERTHAASTNKTKADDKMSNEPRTIQTGLTPAEEVQVLPHILTPIGKLTRHGYVSEVPSDDAIRKAHEGLQASQGWEKCDRCQQRFQVFPGRREDDGALTSGGPCKFHWGKPYVPPKAPSDTARVPKRYRCCGEEVGESSGCHVQDHHVFKVTDAKRLGMVLNFAATPDNPAAPTDRAVCFDCEMAYTVHGLELVRVTATSWPLEEELLDVLVQPLGEVLDLNSRFSGVWPEDLAQAEPWSFKDEPTPSKSPKQARDKRGDVKSKKLKVVSSPEIARGLFFSLISPTTPLIGHGLENDLNALRVIHPILIDTALLYPHKAGLPYRNGLKMLMELHLNRKIQQESGPKLTGHDSGEDARAAGELVRLKVMKEWKDLQWMGWKAVKGTLLSPDEQSAAEGGLTAGFIES